MMTQSYQGTKFTRNSCLWLGKMRKPAISSPPTNDVSRTSSSIVPNSVTYTSKIANAARYACTAIFGLPSQARVFDSRSYFRMTSLRFFVAS